MTKTNEKLTYDAVMAAVAEGAKVTEKDLEVAVAYAKRVRKAQPKNAVIKQVRNTKHAGKTCIDPGCDRPAVAKGRCMSGYVREYRKDAANRERANEASRKYAAKKRAERESEVSLKSA